MPRPVVATSATTPTTIASTITGIHAHRQTDRQTNQRHDSDDYSQHDHPRCNYNNPLPYCCHIVINSVLIFNAVTLLCGNNTKYPIESEGICFHRRWFVCLSVCRCACMPVTTITKKIVDGFAPSFTRRFLGEREDQVRVSLRSVEGCGSNGQKTP